MAELPAETDPTIRVLRVAVDAMTLLVHGWQGRKCQCDRGYYAPDVIRHFLNNWTELETAVEGVSAAGANAIGGRGAADTRRTLIAIKADLELATDKAFTNGRYLQWRTVASIYRRQNRESYYLARRRELTRWVQEGHTLPPANESWRPLAEAQCIELIAGGLGWTAHDVCEVA